MSEAKHSRRDVLFQLGSAAARELGMPPIQQGIYWFCASRDQGEVSGGTYQLKPNWCQVFEGTAQLDPLDPLFHWMGRQGINVAYNRPTAFYKKLSQWEQAWLNQSELYPTQPKGDSVTLRASLRKMEPGSQDRV